MSSRNFTNIFIMALNASRYLAFVYAIGLGIGETVLNWGNWQYAPLWIVDYIVVAWLLWGVFITRYGHNIAYLMAAWAFTIGIFYMALFVSLDPELAAYLDNDPFLLYLMSLMLFLSVLGLVSSVYAMNSTKNMS